MDYTYNPSYISHILGLSHNLGKKVPERPFIHDICTVEKHYVIEIYAAIIEGKKPVSYTHLTLPTIYSV